MKDNLQEDVKDGIYTGLIASALAAYVYGLSSRVNILSYGSMPNWAYIGLATTVGTTISQILVDADEPLLSAAASAAISVGANYLVDSPVSPLIVGVVSGPPALVRQLNKKKCK